MLQDPKNLRYSTMFIIVDYSYAIKARCWLLCGLQRIGLWWCER